VLHLKGQGIKARALLRDAIQHETQAFCLSSQVKEYRQELCKQNRTLARCLLGLGDHAGAAEAAAEVVRFTDTPDQDGYLAAYFLAQCLALVGKDAALAPAAQQAARRRYAEDAIARLRRIDPSKLSRFKPLESDPDFAPLRDHPDFKKEASRWHNELARRKP
jgi:hypothetical protein